jgi:hypothetical protein
MHGKVRFGRHQKIQLPTGTHRELLDCDLLRYSRQMEVIELAKRVGVDVLPIQLSLHTLPAKSSGRFQLEKSFPPSRAGDFNFEKSVPPNRAGDFNLRNGR